MASDTVTYTLNLKTGTFTKEAKKAEDAVAKVGTAATGTAKKFGGFADAVGKTSTTLARSASLFGLNANALRALDDAADVAELGLKNLTKSTAGFNAATIGVIGAGAAMGAMLGSWANQFKSVRTFADDATRGLYDMLAAIKVFESKRGGAGTAGLAQDQIRWAKADAEAKQKRFAMLTGLGMNPEQLKVQFGFSKGKDPMLAQIEAMEEKHKKQLQHAEETKRIAEREAQAWTDAAEKARAAWDKFYDDFKSQTVDLAREMSALLGERAQERFGGTAQGAFDQMQRFVSKGMGGSGKLLSEETTNVSKFWSRDAEIQAGLDESGGSLFGEATKAGVDFSAMLDDVAHAFQILGVGPDSVLGRVVGSLAVAASSFKSFQGAGGLGALTGKNGISGIIGAAVPALGLVSAGFSLIKGLFGGGKSKEQKEAERQQAEQEKRRIQDAAKQMRSQSIDQLGGAASSFFMGRTITTEDDAKRSGTLFIDAWTQVVKEKGVLAAADAFGGAFDKMKADIEKAGIAMPDWMKAIEGQMGLSKNEGFRAAATGSQNAASFLGALGGAGGLSPESFRAFEQEARAQFAAAEGAAKEAGLDAADATKAGFSATNPLLKELLNQSVVTGQTLSDDIQAMVDAAGIVPDVDIQQLSELQQIRAAVQAMAGGGGAVPGPAAGGPGGGGSGGSAGVGSGEGRYPGFATGGNVTRTGLALVHQGEQIISKSDVQSGGNVTIGPINVQASGNKATDDEMVHKIGVVLGDLVRRGRAARLTAALKDDGFARRGKK